MAIAWLVDARTWFQYGYRFVHQELTDIWTVLQKCNLEISSSQSSLKILAYGLIFLVLDFLFKGWSTVPYYHCSFYHHRYKLRNIEETEAAKKMLQEKRLAGKPKSDSNIPSSYSADYFHRGKEYDEKLRRGLLHVPLQAYIL